MAITNEQRDALEKRAKSWISRSYSTDPAWIAKFMARYDNAAGTTIKEKVLNGLFNESPYGPAKSWCPTVTGFAREALNDTITKDEIDHYWIQKALNEHYPEREFTICNQCGQRISREDGETDVEKLREVIRDLRARLANRDQQARTDEETLRAVYNYIGGREPAGEARNRHVAMLPRPRGR